MFFNGFILTSHRFYAHYTSLTVNDVAIEKEILPASLALRSLLRVTSAIISHMENIQYCAPSAILRHSSFSSLTQLDSFVMQ